MRYRNAALRAHLLLPAEPSMEPRMQGTMTNSERRVLTFCPGPSAPPGKGRPDWEIFAVCLGRRLGYRASVHLHQRSLSKLQRHAATLGGRLCDVCASATSLLRAPATARSNGPLPKGRRTNGPKRNASHRICSSQPPTARRFCGRFCRWALGEPIVGGLFPFVLTVGRYLGPVAHDDPGTGPRFLGWLACIPKPLAGDASGGRLDLAWARTAAPGPDHLQTLPASTARLSDQRSHPRRHGCFCGRMHGGSAGVGLEANARRCMSWPARCSGRSRSWRRRRFASRLARRADLPIERAA